MHVLIFSVLLRLGIRLQQYLILRRLSI